jgi:hypothetical protein
MHGGRLASAANKNELKDLIAATSIDEFWIGAYRSETPGGKIILSDGRRKVREGIPEQPVLSQTANGKYVQVAKGQFIKKLLSKQSSHKYVPNTIFVKFF